MNSKITKSLSLVLISFLALFLELVLIRWLPANILSLAYFSNIVLIASFLGLGLGAILASKKKQQDIFSWFPLVFLMIVTIFVLLRQFEVILFQSNAEWLWSHHLSIFNNLPFRIGLLPTLILVFSLTAGLFVFIGQKIGLLLTNFKPLKAYGLNLLGSILGVIVFGFLSFMGSQFGSPVIWFGLVGLITLWFLRNKRLFILIGFICAATTVFIVYNFSKGEIWSPYYSIQIKNHDNGSFSLFVNRFFHQAILNFEADPRVKEKYSLPYTLKTPKKLLILGAGTGNDVAIAVMHNVSEIEAVEIDPVIVKLGEDLHPDKPYQNSNVKVFIDDARSFLKKNNKKYDMIILSTLDSHALLSALSTVRLDNFVYTLESLNDIKNHLTDDGIVVLMFSVTPNHWLSTKLIRTVAAVFDNPLPLVYFDNSPFLFNLAMVAGPGLNNILADESIDKSSFLQVAQPVDKTTDLPTDDWPYLYLFNRTIPNHYLKAIVLLLLISSIGIFLFCRQKRNMFNWQTINFFSLGAAFLLLETKTITTLSLLFGSTWLVNAFVFGSVLLMILLANFLVSKREIKNIKLIYLFLGLALLLDFLLPINYFLFWNFWFRSIFLSLLISLPLFFGSIIFLYHFKTVQDIAAIYGINLAGAVLGGFLEYSSMIIGLNNLYLLAAGFYFLSFLSLFKTKISFWVNFLLTKDEP